jgi:hypothetical protein
MKLNMLECEAFIMLFQLKLLKGVNTLSRGGLTPSEIRFLQEALGADYKIGKIRLREGEYQYDLAKAIASFQLELYLPDVKDIIKRLYGAEKTNDIKFIRKIQTILKKMEKSNVVRILPKKKPWELQRYALSSFKFQDVDKNLVILATDQQIKQMQSLLHSILSQQETPAAKLSNIKARICILVFIVVASYAAILWALMQPAITPIIFVPAFSIAVACSLMLGKTLSRE